ncbi:glycosyltransferase [Desulfovibrio sp.]|uniref:glycosyltransferase family 2 protein n=1 Tax=Desulfovibrio sp. TaxID=885 RepID=UPI0025BB8AF1|nr:glycosyltransferase [Desulfovibrio sp.]
MKEEYKKLFQPHFDGLELPEIADEPLVSIIMGHYNCEKYLPEFLDALIAQTYTNWELLLVDDCSPSGGAEAIVAAYGDSRIHFAQLEQNSGAGTARNAAFAMSRGEYIVCFDPDDIMHPWFLHMLVSTALDNSSPDIVMYDLQCFGSSLAVWKGDVKDERSLTLKNWIISQSLVKRALWDATGGYSTAEEIRKGSMDWEFWLHAAEYVSPLKVAHVPVCLMLYRRHDDSMSAKSDFHEYSIRKRILVDRPTLFERYGTGETFLAEGYAMSFYAHADVRSWRKAFAILREGWQTLPAPLLWRSSKKPIKELVRIGLRRLGRKYILNPLGLMPKNDT